MKCINGHELTISRGQQHHYTSCGLPNVQLFNIETRTCSTCGEFEVVLPNVEELHKVIANAVISKKAPLTALEFRFLRKHLGWSSQDLARRFGVQPETVSRWENEKEPLSKMADRLMRLSIAQFAPVDDYTVDAFDMIDISAAAGGVEMEIRHERRGAPWRPNEASM